MKIHFQWPVLYLYLIVIVGLSSCSDIQSPVGETKEDLVSSVTAIPGESVAINNYVVTFNGKSYDNGTDQSTFSYTVTGTGVEPALNNFFIEVPTCAGTPVAFHPVESAKVTEAGITWEASVPTEGSQDYSITYSGDLPTGAVNATVESGNTTETAEIPGPCKGIYTISGTVYVDANENQQKDLSESGVRNVTVSLVTPENETLDQITALNGEYSFSVFTGSNSVDFDVVVSEITADTTDFNEQLFDTYTATTLTRTTVTVHNADVTGTDFGFVPQTQRIILQFEDGSILLNTEEPKFWIKQLRSAQKGNGNAEVTPEQLLGYLNVIEGLLLEDPFQFGENKIDAALDILTRPIKSDFESLLVQLLTAELNVVSGRGSNSLDFDLALLAFGESAAAEAAAAPVISSSTSTSVTSSSTDSNLNDAETLLTSFNSSGGGGGVGNN